MHIAPTITTTDKNVRKTLARLAMTAPLLVFSLSSNDKIANAADARTTVISLSRSGSLPTEKDLNRHNEFMARKEHLLKTGGTQLVFIGDSITDGWRIDPQREIFEDYFGQYRPYNIGVGGDQTQNVLWRIEHDELDGIAPKAAVLLIGINNLGAMTPEETAEGITTLVMSIRQKLPNTKILLQAIFPCGNRLDEPFRARVNQTNAMIAKLDDGRHIKYLDIGAKFLDPNGNLSGTVMPDYLHPNVRGYEIWAEAIKSTVDALEK